MSVVFKSNYMKQNKVVYPNLSVINIYIVYKLDEINAKRNTDFSIQNALFGAIKITKDINTTHYKYNGYGICFDVTLGNITNGKNVIIFGVDMTFSTHKGSNNLNSIYVLGRGEIQGLSTTGTTSTIYAEKMYKTNFTEPNKKFVLSLHYNGDNSYLFVNGVEQLKFKTDINEIQKNLLCLGNLSSDWSITNSTNAGLYGGVYGFAVDYVPINNGVGTIYDIHRYLMKKHNIV